MKKLLGLSAGILAMSVFCATAEQAAPPPVPGAAEGAAAQVKADKVKPEMKEITVTGTVAQQEMKNKKGEAATGFVLKTDDGAVVRLPAKAKGKGAAQAVKLEDYVGAKVKITGMGFEKEHKGKKMIALQKITAIDKLADAPAAAPAE